MRFRKLRIAWSVAWGVVLLALVVLWVRSYSRHDFWHWPITSQLKVTAQSRQGYIHLSRLPTDSEFQAALSAAGGGQSAVNITSANLGSPNLAISIAPLLDQVSNWSLCTIAAIAGGVAWLPWSRRFGLRTAFVATTLVAVVLGLIVWASRAG
jgi:hypothetical protein